MVDYIHIWVENPNILAVLKHPLLYESFNMLVGSNTAEIKGKQVRAVHENIEFNIIDNHYLDIKGSIHKYSKGGSNHTDFSFDDLVFTIKEFCHTFYINPNQAIIKSFEFGVNLSLIPKIYIDAAIIHQTTQPNIIDFNGNGLMKVFCHQQYNFKLYDKSAEVKSNKPILRVEFKVKKMAVIKNVNITSLFDLLDLGKIRKLKKYLIKPISEIVFYEMIENMALNSTNSLLYANAGSSNYWKKLSIDDREKFKYYRKKVNKINVKYGSNTRSILISEIEKKFNYLINRETFDCVIFPKLTHYFPRINQHFIINNSPFLNQIL